MKYLYPLLAICGLLSFPLYSQTVTTVTYTAGNASTDFIFGTINNTSSNSNCPLTLNVSIPAGRLVTAVEVSYNIQALGSGWMSEQRSYLECVTTGNKESMLYPGPATNSAGTHSYNRSGLTIANGIVPAGGLQFRLHAFRTFGSGACNSSFQQVLNNTFIIKVTHYPPPTCPPPSSPGTTNISANAASLSWTSGGANNWQVEYGPAGFSPGSGTILNVASNPFNLTGLSASTYYEWRVRDSCGTGDVSVWSPMRSFRTTCATISAPYSEDFESVDWVVANFSNVGSIDTCFSRNYANTFTFETGPPLFLSSFSGPSGDHTSGSGKYIFSEMNAFGSFPDTARIVSPQIDLSPLTVPQLTFWYHMFGFNIGDLKLYISTNGGSSYTSIFSKSGQQQNAQNDPWAEAIVNLSAYANQTVMLKFEVVQASFGVNGDVSIDDLAIQEAPSCPKPQNLSANYIWHDRVELSWLSGGASNWEIEYGSPGFSLGSGTRLAVNNNPATVSGLTAASSYEFYVRDSCGAGDVSVWVGPLQLKTLCLPASAPWLQSFSGPAFGPGPNFNDTGFVSSCWYRNRTDLYVWKGGPPNFPSFNTGPDKDKTTGLATGKYAYTASIGFSTATPIISELETRIVDLSPLSTPELSFWYHMYGQDIGGLEVLVNRGDGNWTSLWSVNGQQQSARSDAWLEAIVNMSAYAGDSVQLRFVASKSGFGNRADIAIDDIDFHEQPSCPKPQNLQFIGSTHNSVTLGWTSGGATNWNIEYGPQGFSQGNGTVVNAASNPFSVSGLSANTSYSFYVRDSCGSADVSLWIGPVNATTDCAPLSAPYSENFDGTSWTDGFFSNPGSVDPCWTRDPNIAYLWMPQTSSFWFGSGPQADHTTGSGRFMMASRVSTIGRSLSDDAVLESPLIDLSALSIPELSFWYHMVGSNIDSLTVDVFDGSSYTRVYSLQGQQQSAVADPFDEAIVNLAAYANDTIKLRFITHTNGTFTNQNNAAIDDVDIHEQPSCPKPSFLTVQSTAATSVTLNWTTGGATNWQIEYGAPGFSLGSGTLVNASSNPFTVTGLNSSTSYEFYLRDSCGAGDVSAWLGPKSATTDCLPVAAPFSENFDGNSWQVGTNFNDTGSVSQCWPRSPLGDYVWKPGPPNFPAFQTGPSGDHTTGNGKYIMTESIFSGGSPPFDSYLESPQIDLSPLNNPQLVFWYHMYGQDIDSLVVEIDNGSGYQQLHKFSGQQQSSSASPWLELIVNLSAYANDTVQIRFKGSKDSFGNRADIALDDFAVEEAPSCPKPQFLTTVSKNSTGFNLSWIGGGASNWQIEYGPQGFTPGSGTLVAVNSNPFYLGGLTANTVYDMYVRDSCGVGDVSVWSSLHTDTTLCSVFSTPFSENFDGPAWVVPLSIFDTTLIDPCWNRSNRFNYFWRAHTGSAPGFNTGPSADHTTGNGKYLVSDMRVFGVNNTTTLYSPLFDLNGLTSPQVRFWYHMFGNGIDKLELDVWNGSNWVPLDTISGQQQTSQSAAWLEDIVDLSSYAGDTVQLRFKAYILPFSAAVNLAIDDFWIGEAPTCPQPSNIVVNNTTTTSVTLSWTSGGASNWLVSYRPSGSTAPLSTVVAGSNSNFVVSGLNPSTAYDFYVQDSCGLGDISFLIGPVSASTACGVVTAPWSESFNGSSWLEGLGTLNTGNTISNCWARPSGNNPHFGTGFLTTSSVATGPNSDASGSGKYIYTEYSGGAIGPGRISTPFIYLPPNLLNPRLKFSYHMFGNDIDSLYLELSNGGGFSWKMGLTGQQQSSNAAAWRIDSLDLSAYIGDTIRIRFSGLSHGFNGDIALDDIAITADSNSCAIPGALGFSSVTTTTATVSWNSNAAVSTVEVLPLGQPRGSGTFYYGATSPLALSGLSPATSYLVYLQDSCGPAALSNWIVDTLVTQACPIVTAAFNVNSAFLNVSFNSSAAVNADSLFWDFGDGNSQSGSNPAYVYAAAGTYYVCLEAFNHCGTTDIYCDSLRVCDSLLLAFSSQQNGDTVSFDASASSGAIGYDWDFGDGNSGSGLSVIHIYTPSSTNRIVTLRAYNECGDTLSKTAVISLCPPPVADWSYQIIQTTPSGMEVQFDGTLSQNAVSWHWTFGDGTTDNSSSQPKHTYLTPGLFYKVTLKVTNSCGDESTRAFRLSEIGLAELPLLAEIKVYPNPARERLKLEWPANEIRLQQISISDVSGKLLLRQNLPENKGAWELDISHLPPGNYHLHLQSDAVKQVKALLIR